MAEKNDGIACPVVLIGTFLLFLLLFWGGGMMGWGGMMYGWNGNGMMGGNSLLNVFFWVGIIILVWWVLKRSMMARGSRGEPIEILNRRYAAGEIGKTEYLRMKHEISK